MADEEASESVIADVEREIREGLEKWKEIGATPIPKTLKEARDTKWELASDLVQVGALLSYPKEQQEVDGRRVIRLDKAMAIIDAIEAELIAQLVVRPTNPLSKIGSDIVGAISAAITGVQNLWRYGGTRILWTILRTLVQHIFVTIGAAILIAAITRAIKTRTSIEREMRKSALPQRSAKRYRRRKVSRR